MQIEVDNLLDFLKKKYEIIYADSMIESSLNATEEQVFLTPKHLAAAFNDAVDKGEKIGIMKGKLYMIQDIFKYLSDTINEQHNM